MSYMVGICLLALLIFFYDLPRIKKDRTRERSACVALTIAGWLILLLTALFPHMPGTTQLMEIIYKPVTKFLR
ncbi:hypothetical protein I8J29_02825 [Paenibacillus sp. MWE-103]|uniref:Uncharacterized protein n=1 Tax=Paenibacillus artemisiicola TaxID=1172618 RepID=A0ABS3W4B5_9BACL|nr:hypothetical protein [Paenibacillus artemisiicola]MBO7743114.1 hypothetical protein [Paenibacillus artemisiicola]